MATKYIFLDMIFQLYWDDGTHASNPVSREISENISVNWPVGQGKARV